MSGHNPDHTFSSIKDSLRPDSAFSTTRLVFAAPDPPGEPVHQGEVTGLQGGGRSKGFCKKSMPGLPLVTVVTVVLNEVESLEYTINSVLRQSYDNIEFIVIDGGSSRPTLDVIKKYEDKIDFWLSEPDRGIFDAMNKGIELASGDWINFLNCGDSFYRDDTLRTVFSQNFGAADFIYGHSDFQAGDFRGVVKAWDFSILWKTMIFTHQSLFSRTAILKERKFNLNFHICADYDLIYNAWASGLKFHNSDTVIASFNPGFSDISRARMAWEKWRVVSKHRKDLLFHFFYLQLFLKRWLRDTIFHWRGWMQKRGRA
jgi:glycosyltransferase involved in cell wall biosynthesis